MKTLYICEKLFENLNSRGIKYCHWKSNIHLDRALEGKTDLDILVHYEHKRAFENVLQELSIKKILSPPEKRFPGLEDFLGFDYSTGQLIHVHLHYKLVLGQRYIKNHHLPIEDLIFRNLILKCNVHIPCPEIELILLIIRAHMKVDVISLVKHGIKGFISQGYTPFPANIESEFSDLIKRSNVEKLRDLLKESRLPLTDILVAQFIERFSEGKLKFQDILRTQWTIFSDLKEFRRNKSKTIYIRYFLYTIGEFRGFNRLIRPGRKVLPRNGAVFSLVGADGSGKSTLVKDLDKWLGWKMSVKKYYYGIPKTRFIQIISSAIRGSDKFGQSLLSTLFKNYLWIHIARKRYRISVSARKYANAGNIVITDRFPLKEFYGMTEPMDGPRINRNGTRMGDFFSGVEKSFYDNIVLPDCIFVLQVSLEELRRRKSDLDLGTHNAKAEAVNAIDGNAHTLLVDADKLYADVQLEIKRKIWELI